MNIVILTKVNVISISYVDIPDRASNKLRSDAIRLGTIYVCDVTKNYIPATIFARE